MILLLWYLGVLGACHASHPAQITPFAHPRRQITSAGDTCGYENAYVLSLLTCEQGLSCASNLQNNVAGGCCRLGDASCVLATACVESVSLSSSCDASCQSNSHVTKCSDATAPYCYTRYWVSGAVTPSELGCTSTQGLVAYAYSTYTGFGAEITPVGATSVIATPGMTDSGTGTAASTGSVGGGGGSQAEADVPPSGGGDGVPAGAIAGGVVGGVAVLGIVVALIVWMVLRHRRQQKGKAAGGAWPSNGSSDAQEPKTAIGAISPNAPGDASLVIKQKGANFGVASPAELSQRDAERSWEMGGQRKHEADGRTAVPELP